MAGVPSVGRRRTSLSCRVVERGATESTAALAATQIFFGAAARLSATGGRSGQDDVHRACGADVARRLEAEPAQVDPGEEGFAAAEHGRRDREVHLVDETGLEVLADDETPPPMRTSRPCAAARACASASRMPPVTNGKVVPPSISSGARG
jgi:hypothetical protein